MIPEGDKKFVETKLLPWAGIKAVILKWSDSTARWPDIWVTFGRGLPTITMTAEWERQNVHERRKRLVHEFLHIKGLNHPRNGGMGIGKFVYSTYPDKDTYSKYVYRGLR